MRLKICLTICLSIATAAFAKEAVHHHRNNVPGQYMILLDKDIAASAYDGVVQSLAASHHITVLTEWRESPRGLIGYTTESSDIERLASDARISLVEEDFTIALRPSGMQWTNWNGYYLWYLDRLDEPTYATHDSQYDMCPEAREVAAYVIDLGVRADHEQFTLNEPPGRVESHAFDDGSQTGYVDTTNGCTAGATPNYNLWHGTAVAGLVGGTTTGAAKVHIVSLRPGDCNGFAFASNFVNAVRWIRSANDQNASSAGVVSMSLWFGDWQPDFATISTTIDTRVRETGIPFFASANNFSGDACKFTPANLAYTNMNHNGTVFSVGGTSLGANGDTNDYRWQTWDGGLAAIGQDSGSNGGQCVSIYAPACDIYIAQTTSSTAYTTLSGTSFSAPLAAAVAARYISSSGVRGYQQVYDHLLSVAGPSSLVNNVSTPESWVCKWSVSPYTWYGYRTDPGTCPANQQAGGTTPVHFSPTSNTSNAGMLFSDMTCP